MTFKETEFPSWITFLKSLEQKNPNPFLIRDIIRLMIRLYEKSPLYPGIVEMCLAQALQSVDPEKIETGEKIYFFSQGTYYAGEILHRNLSEIKVRTENGTALEESFPLKELRQTVRLNQNIFEELWPSLVFEQKKNEI